MWEVLLSYIEIGYGWLFYKGPAIIFFVILVAVAVVALYYKRKKGKDISIHPPNRPPKDKTTGSQEREHKGNDAPGPGSISPPLAGDTFKDCDDCPEMVIVPAGEFWMGSPKDEPERYSGEVPQHKVTISQPFAVGKYPVTRGQFEAFIEATEYDAGSGKGSWLEPDFTQTDKHPVVSVSWDDAEEYTEWLSQKTGKQYRLLSEAEWEYAARAGTTTAYHFGNRIFPKQANYGENKNGTTKVGSYPANKFGLHDVHGNVCEWVEDCWHTDYTGAPTDGSAWVDDDRDNRTHRVLRGGSWIDGPGHLRSANRGGFSGNLRLVNRGRARVRANGVGFRIARTL